MCLIRKWPDYDSYGFDLHYDVPKEQVFIGGIDEGSPAEAGGLKTGDRVIEVNDEPVEGKSHSEVVALVKQRPLQTSLLVVDEEANGLFTAKGIKIVSTLKTVRRLETPERVLVVPETQPELEVLNFELQ